MERKNVVGPIFGFITSVFCFLSVTCFFLKAWIVFWIFLILCLASSAVFIAVSFHEIRNFFNSRQLRYGTNVALSILGVIGIAVFINVIVAERLNKRFDLTELRQHSLSDETKKIIKTLDKKVNIIAFYTNSNRYLEAVKDLLELYTEESHNLNVSIIDPENESNIAGKYGIERDGTTVFDDGNRFEIATIGNQQAFTSALLRVIQNRTKKVYFLVGHGERSIDDFSNRGYKQVKTELEKINYAVFSLSLLKEEQIPLDCDALVIAAPTIPLKRQELDVIERFLAKNGKLLLLLDPSHNSPEDVNNGITQMMKKWGVKIGNDLVHDRVHSFLLLGGSTALDVQYEPHDITRNFFHLQIPYIDCRSVTPMEDIPASLSIKTIAKTVGSKGVSWGETERSEDGGFSRNGYTPNVDLPAPVSIAVAIEQSIDEEVRGEEGTTPTRIVVFGDSHFASDAFFATNNPKIPAYPPLFNSIINWLTFEDDLVSISQIDPNIHTLSSMNNYQVQLVQILSVFLIPLIVFATGIVVWWVRREGGTR